MLNQYSSVPRERSSIAGKEATRQARAQIYASVGTQFINELQNNLLVCKDQYLTSVQKAVSALVSKTVKTGIKSSVKWRKSAVQEED